MGLLVQRNGSKSLEEVVTPEELHKGKGKIHDKVEPVADTRPMMAKGIIGSPESKSYEEVMSSWVDTTSQVPTQTQDGMTDQEMAKAESNKRAQEDPMNKNMLSGFAPKTQEAVVESTQEKPRQEGIDSLNSFLAKSKEKQMSLFGGAKQGKSKAPSRIPKKGGGVVAVGKRGGKIYGYDSKGKPIYSKKEAQKQAQVKGGKKTKKLDEVVAKLDVAKMNRKRAAAEEHANRPVAFIVRPTVEKEVEPKIAGPARKDPELVIQAEAEAGELKEEVSKEVQASQDGAWSAQDVLDGKAPYKVGDNLSAAHDSEDTAYVIDDYPYGRDRTEMRVWVETTKHGQRVCRQTLNPKTGKWNKPKKGNYVNMEVLYMNEAGHVKTKGMSIQWSEGATIRKFVEEHKEYVDRLPATNQIEIKSAVAYHNAKDRGLSSGEALAEAKKTMSVMHQQAGTVKKEKETKKAKESVKKEKAAKGPEGPAPEVTSKLRSHGLLPPAEMANFKNVEEVWAHMDNYGLRDYFSGVGARQAYKKMAKAAQGVNRSKLATQYKHMANLMYAATGFQKEPSDRAKKALANLQSHVKKHGPGETADEVKKSMGEGTMSALGSLEEFAKAKYVSKKPDGKGGWIYKYAESKPFKGSSGSEKVVDESSARAAVEKELSSKIRRIKSTLELRDLSLRPQVVQVYSSIFGLASKLVHGDPENNKYLGGYTDKKIDTIISEVLKKEFPKLLGVMNTHKISNRVWKSMEDKTMSALDTLAQYGLTEEELEKAQSIPEGNPKQGLGQGEEQGGNLKGVGQTSGSNDAGGGQAKASPDKKDKLSEDDAEDEKQMKTHKKPIETRKSMTSPMGQREQVAHENAQAVSQLRKGQEDVQVGIGVVSPVSEPEALEKAQISIQGPDALVVYSNKADLDAERLLKSNDFYVNGNPTITPASLLIHEQMQCPACKHNMAKSLSACPSCGYGTSCPQVLPVETGKVNLEKARGPGLRRARQEQDIVLVPKSNE